MPTYDSFSRTSLSKEEVCRRVATAIATGGDAVAAWDGSTKLGIRILVDNKKGAIRPHNRGVEAGTGNVGSESFGFKERADFDYVIDGGRGVLERMSRKNGAELLQLVGNGKTEIQQRVKDGMWHGILVFPVDGLQTFGTHSLECVPATWEHWGRLLPLFQPDEWPGLENHLPQIKEVTAELARLRRTQDSEALNSYKEKISFPKLDGVSDEEWGQWAQYKTVAIGSKENTWQKVNNTPS